MRPELIRRLTRILAELALLTGAGLFMGFVGPYGSGALPPAERYPYWLGCIGGGGVIGVAIDEGVRRRIGDFWRRLAASSLLMTPAVALLVIAIGQAMFGPARRPPLPYLLWQVLVISVAVMALRILVWRDRAVVMRTRTVIAPPLPEAEAAFRRRLSAKRRGARLIAVEAHDHYLRVHTDAGPELVTLRFAEALEELAGAHGFRTHRSWWVAAGAIEQVRWRRGAGEAVLAGEIVAPVSRTHAPALKAAGWF